MEGSELLDEWMASAAGGTVRHRDTTRSPRRKPRCHRATTPGLATVLLFALLGTAAAQLPSSPDNSPAAPPGSATRGEQLFSGVIPFQTRGPACAACHSVAGLPFPNGGTLGPDLTRIYDRMGPMGMDVALRTLYFPAMSPLYADHPLSAAERADLAAFFAQAAKQPSARPVTPAVLGIAVIGGLLLLALTAFAWRDRLRGVRAKLLASARRQTAMKGAARELD